MLSEFIQRNPNYDNIKRNNFIIHNYIKKTHNTVKKKNMNMTFSLKEIINIGALPVK